MANLNLAQTGSPLSTNPVTTLLSHFSGANWTATPAASAITFGRRFSNLSKNYAVIIKLARRVGPAQILGSTRYRVRATYRIHVWAKGATETDALDKKFAIENEIKRIVKTSVTALQASGFDEIHLDDDFTEIETGNENLANSGQAGDVAIVVRSVANLTLIYDEVVGS